MFTWFVFKFVIVVICSYNIIIYKWLGCNFIAVMKVDLIHWMWHLTIKNADFDTYNIWLLNMEFNKSKVTVSLSCLQNRGY